MHYLHRDFLVFQFGVDHENRIQLQRFEAAVAAPDRTGFFCPLWDCTLHGTNSYTYRELGEQQALGDMLNPLWA